MTSDETKDPNTLNETSCNKNESKDDNNSCSDMNIDECLIESLIEDFRIDLISNKPKKDIEELILKATAERRELLENNSSLQTKLVSNLFTTKSNDVKIDKNTETMLQYYKLLDEFIETKNRTNEIIKNYEVIKSENNIEYNELCEFEKDLQKQNDESIDKILDHFISKLSNSSRTKLSTNSNKLMENLELGNSKQLIDKLCEIKTENICLSKEGQRLDDILLKSDEAMTGSNLIDYEQLKSDNQNLAEKINSRLNEINKIQSKIELNQQECKINENRLKSCRDDHQKISEKLYDLRSELSESRKSLNKIRNARDMASKSLSKEKNLDVSLIGSSQALLNDYENLSICSKD